MFGQKIGSSTPAYPARIKETKQNKPNNDYEKNLNV